MRLLKKLHKWWKRKPLRVALREVEDRELDDEIIERERRTAIPIDANDVSSLPDRFIRDLRYVDTWF
jgi:hypothetical protein